MPDIKAVVQRMIDAGESEENIAKVIQHAKSVMITPGDTVQARAHMNEQEGPAPSGTIKGMVSMGQSMAHPGIDTETGKAKSTLGTLGDAAMLAIPSMLGMEGRSITDAGSRYWQGTKAAARDTKSMRDVATLPVRAYQKVKDALPSSNEAAVEEFLGPTRGPKYEPKPPTINGAADVVDRNMPAVKRAPVPAPPQAKAPTLDEALQQALEQNMGADPARSSTSADVVPTGGSQKPRLGKRPGGYTTDIPARGEAPAPVETPPAAPSGKSAKFEESTSDPLDELMNALHGDEASPHINPEGHGTMAADKPHFNSREVSTIMGRTGGQMLPNSQMADVASSLRRLKGSRDAGRAMFPEMTAAERGELVKKLAPGPSQVPLEAEQRITDAARKAKGDDLPSVLLAMLTGGAGALSSRQTTSNLGGLQ